MNPSRLQSKISMWEDRGRVDEVSKDFSKTSHHRGQSERPHSRRPAFGAPRRRSDLYGQPDAVGFLRSRIAENGEQSGSDSSRPDSAASGRYGESKREGPHPRLPVSVYSQVQPNPFAFVKPHSSSAPKGGITQTRKSAGDLHSPRKTSSPPSLASPTQPTHYRLTPSLSPPTSPPEVTFGYEGDLQSWVDRRRSRLRTSSSDVVSSPESVALSEITNTSTTSSVTIETTPEDSNNNRETSPVAAAIDAFSKRDNSNNSQLGPSSGRAPFPNKAVRARTVWLPNPTESIRSPSRSTEPVRSYARSPTEPIKSPTEPVRSHRRSPTEPVRSPIESTPATVSTRASRSPIHAVPLWKSRMSDKKSPSPPSTRSPRRRANTSDSKRSAVERLVRNPVPVGQTAAAVRDAVNSTAPVRQPASLRVPLRQPARHSLPEDTDFRSSNHRRSISPLGRQSPRPYVRMFAENFDVSTYQFDKEARRSVRSSIVDAVYRGLDASAAEPRIVRSRYSVANPPPNDNRGKRNSAELLPNRFSPREKPSEVDSGNVESSSETTYLSCDSTEAISSEKVSRRSCDALPARESRPEGKPKSLSDLSFRHRPYKRSVNHSSEAELLEVINRAVRELGRPVRAEATPPPKPARTFAYDLEQLKERTGGQQGARGRPADAVLMRDTLRLVERVNHTGSRDNKQTIRGRSPTDKEVNGSANRNRSTVAGRPSKVNNNISGTSVSAAETNNLQMNRPATFYTDLSGDSDLTRSEPLARNNTIGDYLRSPPSQPQSDGTLRHGRSEFRRTFNMKTRTLGNVLRRSKSMRSRRNAAEHSEEPSSDTRSEGKSRAESNVSQLTDRSELSSASGERGIGLRQRIAAAFSGLRRHPAGPSGSDVASLTSLEDRDSVVDAMKCVSLDRRNAEDKYQQLFDYVFVVGLNKSPDGAAGYQPAIIYRFPPDPSGSDPCDKLDAIPSFCFPDARLWAPVEAYRSETFSFVLTSEDGSRLFGYCRRFLPPAAAGNRSSQRRVGGGPPGVGNPRLPETYCIISPLGCFGLYEAILNEVEEHRSISTSAVFAFLKSVINHPFPRAGEKIEVDLPDWQKVDFKRSVLVLQRPLDSRLEHVNFDCLFSSLSVTKVIQVFASLLLERRVILSARKISKLSECVHALSALLYPFQWQHTYIPVLPVDLIDMCCSPTPYVVGVLSIGVPELETLPLEEVLLVDLDCGTFVRTIGDESSLLPSRLVEALENSIYSVERGDCPQRTVVVESFLRFFVELLVGFHDHLTSGATDRLVRFDADAFRRKKSSKSLRRFLKPFNQTQMMGAFIHREARLSLEEQRGGLFHIRLNEYVKELSSMSVRDRLRRRKYSRKPRKD